MKLLHKHVIIITAVYCIIIILLFYEHGVKNVNDSHRYLEYASNLKNGFYVERHNFWYIGYALFIFLIHSINDNELAIVLAQYAISYIAVILIYKTSIIIFNNPKKALACSLYYILFIEILSWNSYILCESIYLSLTCISLYWLSSVYKRSPDFWTYFFAVLFVSLTFFTKPTGVALLGAVSGVLVYNLWKQIDQLYVRIGIVSFSLVIFAVLVNKMLDSFLVMENYQIGEIVYAISTLPQKPEYRTLISTPPSDIYLPNENYPPVIKIFLFIIYNPVYWIKLFCLKVFYFFVHIRPYWSLKHNVFCILTLLPIYFYCLRGIIQKVLSKNLAIFTLTYLSIHTLSVGITTVDWDGRFLMPLLPLLFLLGTNGLTEDLEKIHALIKNKLSVIYRP